MKQEEEKKEPTAEAHGAQREGGEEGRFIAQGPYDGREHVIAGARKTSEKVAACSVHVGTSLV